LAEDFLRQFDNKIKIKLVDEKMNRSFKYGRGDQICLTNQYPNNFFVPKLMQNLTVGKSSQKMCATLAISKKELLKINNLPIGKNY
jgi:hypothetical protein